MNKPSKHTQKITIYPTIKKKRKIDRAKKRLLNQIELLDKVIAVSPGHIYWLDKNNILLGCNERQAQTLGLKSRQDIVGKSLYDIQPKEVADKLIENNLQVMKGGKGCVFEENFDKENVFYLSHKIPMRDNKGKVVGLIGTSIDITDSKRVEELRMKNEATQKALSFSNLVAGSIAHELKNPLAGIKMQMESLSGVNFNKMSTQEIAALFKNMAVAIIKTIDDTVYVINSMLRKVRVLTTGEVQHNELMETSIVSDVENLLRSYPYQGGESDLVKTKLKVQFEYLGDKILTTHVLGNLMKNALRAIADSDKKHADITIETRICGGCNQLVFRDTATGISKDFMSKVFTQFETRTSVNGGAGLGLSFCKAVMEDTYGGSISCNSEEGEYTEFVLSFPKLKGK